MASSDLYVGRDGKVNEEQIYRDAWRIADPGASNPVAVARTLFRASSVLLHDIGTDGVKKHPALRLIAAQLASLYSVNADGGGGLSGEDVAFIGKVQGVVLRLDAGHNLIDAIRRTDTNVPIKEASHE